MASSSYHFRIAKQCVSEHMMFIPKYSLAEESDFEQWGKKFCVLMKRLETFCDNLKIDITEDEEVTGWITEARQAFSHFVVEAWVPWAGKVLMPELTQAVEAQRRRAEAAKQLQETSDARRCKATRFLMDSKISAEEFMELIKSIGDSRAGEDIKMIEAGSSVRESEVTGGVQSSKRKRADPTTQGTSPRGLCDRCKAFQKTPQCVVAAGAKVCGKCQTDKRGCYWNGISLSGKPRMRMAKNAVFGIDDEYFTVTGPSVLSAPVTRSNRKARGNGRGMGKGKERAEQDELESSSGEEEVSENEAGLSADERAEALKRRRAESDPKPKCDRCANMKKGPVECVFGRGSKTCTRCVVARQACRITPSGKRSPKHKMALASKRKEIVDDDSEDITLSVGVSSSQRTSLHSFPTDVNRGSLEARRSKLQAVEAQILEQESNIMIWKAQRIVASLKREAEQLRRGLA